MSWRERYRDAEFRGISFFVPNDEGLGGRRKVVNELPERDIPQIRDMGRKGRRFTFEAYTIGDDYDLQRNALIEALEKKGPGKLVHPKFGSMNIDILDFGWRETFRETDMCRFNIVCIESGDIQFPTRAEDTQQSVQTAKQEAITQSQAVFEKVYTLLNKPKTISQAAQDTLDDALDEMGKAKTSISSDSNYKRELDTLKGKVIALAYDAVSLAQGLSQGITFGTNAEDDNPVTVDNARSNFDDMRKLFDFQPTQILSDDEFEDPAFLIAQLTRDNAVINAGGLLGVMDYTSADEAIELQTLVLEHLDPILERVFDDEYYLTLYNLRTKIVNDITERVRTLPIVTEYFVPVSLPAAVISYDLYGDIDSEEDIINRNNMEHPGFSPGSTNLEVLTNVQ